MGHFSEVAGQTNASEVIYFFFFRQFLIPPELAVEVSYPVSEIVVGGTMFLRYSNLLPLNFVDDVRLGCPSKLVLIRNNRNFVGPRETNRNRSGFGLF